MRTKYLVAGGLILCLIVATGVFATKHDQSGVQTASPDRQDVLSRLDVERLPGAVELSKAASQLAYAEQLLLAGATDDAISIAGRVVCALPDTSEADKLAIEGYFMLGDFYRDVQEGGLQKSVEYYGLALERMSVEDTSLMVDAIRSASISYAAMGDAREAARLEGIALQVEMGIEPRDLNLVTRVAGPLTRDAGDDTCDLAVGVTLPHSEIMSIAFSGDHNWRSFGLTEASVVRIETISDDIFGDDTDLTLYGGCAAGVPTDFIEFDDDGGPGFLSLIEICLAPGDFFVEVGGFADVATPDDFEFAITVVDTCVIPEPDEFEPDDEIAQANSIGFRNNGVGQGNQSGRDNKNIQNHSIFPAGDIDFVKFELNKANWVRMETFGEANPDTLMGLSYPDGLLIAINDDKAPGDSSSKIEACLPGGEWLVVNLGFFLNDTFPYDWAVDVEYPCTFEVEPNGSFATANPFQIDEAVYGIQTFGPVGDNDFWVFTLDESAFVELETTGYDPLDVDTFLELYDSAGVLLAFDDDGGEGLLSLIGAALDPGTYYVNATISPFDSDWWPYGLTLTLSEPPLTETEPNDDCLSANPVFLGDELLASISPVGDRDSFLLTVPADGFVEVGTDGPSGDTVVKVESADGLTSIGCDDDGGPGLFSLWSCCLSAGDYCVTVRDFGDNSVISAYTVTFSDLGTCFPEDPPVCPSAGLGCPF